MCPGRHRNPLRRQGFTLIEIMAVLVVIGIAASMVVLSMGDATRPQEMKAIAKRLYGGMSLALEDAVFLNRQIGLRFDINNEGTELAYSYKWLYFDPESHQWQNVQLEEFEPQKLPDYIQLELEVDGQNISIGTTKKGEDSLLKVKEDEDGKKGQPEPDLFFLSSGETQSFRLVLSDKDSPERQYIITGDAMGQMKFKRPDEDEK